MITKRELSKLCDARDTLCAFCEVNECSKCIVTHLIDDAHNEVEDQYVCINVEQLHKNKMASPYGNTIVAIGDGAYDLYNVSGELACMNGEECRIVERHDHQVLLANDNSDLTVYFALSAEEFEVAAFSE